MENGKEKNNNIYAENKKAAEIAGDVKKRRKIKLTKKQKNTIVVSVAVVVVVLTAILLGLYFGTQHSVEEYISIPVQFLGKEYKTTVDKTSSYLGHPDLVVADDGTFITAYPSGHGKGAIIMKTCTDGKSWSDRRTDLPASWKTSQETPTLYKLDFKDGGSKLLLASGCPKWPGGYEADGFQFSLSSDNGASWTEFKKMYSPMDCIVALSSLTRVKENGEYIDKWFGTFHTHDFVNYKTYLTFDENGDALWSKPEAFLSSQRRTEKKNKLCEIEIFRTPAPDDGTLIMLARNESRGDRTSMVSFSRDEGKTWSAFKYLPYELSGDRHKAEYDATTGKLIISMRQTVPIKPNALAKAKILSYGWVAWVGTVDDLLSYNDNDSSNDKKGEKIIVLGEDRSADCGYSGTYVDKTGLFTLISYGRFNGVETNYIQSVQFRLSDLTQ